MDLEEILHWKSTQKLSAKFSFGLYWSILALTLYESQI